MTAGLAVPAPHGAALDSEIETLEFEAQGWSSRAESCAPKVFALSSLVNLAPPDPVARVTYTSRGNLLVILGADEARGRAIAESLAPRLNVTVLAPRRVDVAHCTSWGGRVTALEGYLGEFTATISGLQAGNAAPAPAETPAKFDLVLDFASEAHFTMREPPQGYFRAPTDPVALQAMVVEVSEAVGEFEKPRFFAYRENLCAHSRSQVTGCNACIDVCSTQAISSDGDHVKVDPHLCMGCGACSTVCPSGAMGYQYPRVADRGAQVKQLLAAYRHAGGSDAAIVFHDGGKARELLSQAAASGHGLPGRAIPLEVWHAASVGLDLVLPTIAFGATQAVVLVTPGEDREYVAALAQQLALGQEILSALGYEGCHLQLVEAGTPEALAAAFAAMVPAKLPPSPATFLLGNDKRTAIEFAVEHLVKHAPSKVDEIKLAAGAPYGEIRVDRDKCTMCMACVGACPESALMDGVDLPLIKFLERNCVQCGLCANTCPEDAITLNPRLLLTPAVREPRVLNETQPFHCIRCEKPFGTKQMVAAMMGRLAGHTMFTQSGALQRLQMCADCRVVDMMSSKNEVSVLRLGDEA
jgi:ferredoxin